MTLHVDPLEAVWFVTTLAGLILTLAALAEARRELLAVEALTGILREPRLVLTGQGNVRREALRSVVQALLLTVVIPGLFVDRAIPLNPPVVALICVPVVLLLATVLDRRDRGRMALILTQRIADERAGLALESSVQDVKTSVQEVKSLTQHAATRATEAYDVANDVNNKIARLTELVAGKEDKPPGGTQ